MVDIARLQIQIDSSGIKVAGRELDTLARKGTQVGRKLTTRLTVPLVAGMAGAVREAALLEGAFDKFDVVFQGMTREMREFVEVYNEEFPISRRETVQLAAALQDLLVPMGINRKEAAGMTKDWLELAGALSAFNDVPIQQVLDAMRSGIAGMTRPLRQFGIDARSATLEQVALEEGLIRTGEAMSEQVRQQALLIQATRQSADAIGGLEEQKGSLLWQIEELKRDTKDLAAVYGEELMPVASDMIGLAKDWTTAFRDLDEDTRQLIIRAGLLAAAIGPATLGISWALRIMIPLATKGTKAVRALTAAMIANPYLAVGAAILGIGVHVANTTSNIRSLNSELDNIFGGGAESIDQIDQAIARMSDRIERSKRALSGMVADPESMKTIQDMRNQLTKLVEIRNQLVSDRLDGIVSPDETQDVEDATRAVNELVRSIEGVRVAANKPQAPIIDPVEEARIRKIRQEAREFDNVLLDILNTDYDWSHRLSLDDLEGGLKETNKLAEDLGFTFSSAFEDAIVELARTEDALKSLGNIAQSVLQDILRITTRTLVTGPLSDALTGALSGIGGGGVEPVEDLIITDQGRVFKPSPDDTIMAMKNPGALQGNTTNVSAPVNITVNNQTNSQVDVQESRGSDGSREIELLIVNTMKGAHNSGKMDRTMSQNYGNRRKGVNYG